MLTDNQNLGLSKVKLVEYSALKKYISDFAKIYAKVQLLLF